MEGLKKCTLLQKGGGGVNFNIYIYLKHFFDKLTTNQKKISKSLNFDGEGAGGSRPIWEPFP